MISRFSTSSTPKFKRLNKRSFNNLHLSSVKLLQLNNQQPSSSPSSSISTATSIKPKLSTTTTTAAADNASLLQDQEQPNNLNINLTRLSKPNPPNSIQSYPQTDNDASSIFKEFESLQAQAQNHLPGGPIDLYKQRIRDSILQPDQYQLGLVNVLQDLYDQLGNYKPPLVDVDNNKKISTHSQSSWFGNLFQTSSGDNDNPSIPSGVPKGLYLFGSVGTGKSMLMDMFYESLFNLKNPDLTFKRIHFHQFMFEVHQKNHQLQQQSSLSSEYGQLSQSDALDYLARKIASESRILCFDEFQVTDIVDAMILKRLLETMIANGVVCVMTSNRHPDELYKNGIQRESFLPCIDLINQRFLIKDLNSGVDYRKRPSSLSKVFFSPISNENRSEFLKLFEALTDDQPILEDRALKIWGRKVLVPKSTENVAWFDFDHLCGNPLSASDYLEIVKKFPIVFLNDVPKLNLSKRDLARRFILFLDAAYESKTKLFILSEVPIVQIFSDDPSKISGESITPEMRAAMDDLGLDLKTVGSTSLFTGEEETFAWARAVSRLNEMETVNWSMSKKEFRIEDGVRSSDDKKKLIEGGVVDRVIGVQDFVKGVEGDSSSLLIH